MMTDVLVDDGGITDPGYGKKSLHDCKTKRIRFSQRNICLEHPEATCQRRQVFHTLA